VRKPEYKFPEDYRFKLNFHKQMLKKENSEFKTQDNKVKNKKMWIYIHA
jgi:hypothetical protein